MKLNIGYAYGLTDAERTAGAELIPFRRVTLNIINQAVNAKYPAEKGGISDRTVSKVWARIQRALFRAVQDNADVIEISRDGLDFLKVTLETFGAPSGIVHIREDILDLIEAASREDEHARSLEVKARA